MELRKCCNHPFLVEGVEHAEMARLEAEMGRDAYDQVSALCIGLALAVIEHFVISYSTEILVLATSLHRVNQSGPTKAVSCLNYSLRTAPPSHGEPAIDERSCTGAVGQGAREAGACAKQRKDGAA